MDDDAHMDRHDERHLDPVLPSKGLPPQGSLLTTRRLPLCLRLFHPDWSRPRGERVRLAACYRFGKAGASTTPLPAIRSQNRCRDQKFAL